MNVLSFGEILWDLYPDRKCIGGASLNFAAHFALEGGKVWMVSALGEDELGELAMRKLREWKIRTEYVRVIPGAPTGRCFVTLDGNGIPSYDLLSGVAYDSIDLFPSGKEFDALYFGTLALRSETNRKSLQTLIRENRFREIFVDVNIRPPHSTKESVLFALENAAILKVSEEELPAVQAFLGETGDPARAPERLAARFGGLKKILITKGENGSLVYDCETKASESCPAVRAEVVSTVGAGDSFSAVFLYHYFEGSPIDACLRRASEVSAFVVSQSDAVPAAPAFRRRDS